MLLISYGSLHSTAKEAEKNNEYILNYNEILFDKKFAIKLIVMKKLVKMMGLILHEVLALTFFASKYVGDGISENIRRSDIARGIRREQQTVPFSSKTLQNDTK